MLLSPEQAQFVTGYRPAFAKPLSPPDAQPLPSKQVSAEARDSFGFTNISKQARDVLDVVRIAHKAGVCDLTGREIRDWWKRVYIGKDIDTSTLSPRIGELISAGLLERLPKRLCSVSKISAGPVRVIAQQTRLTA